MNDASPSTPRKRGFVARFVNALRPTEVYVAREIVPPFVPHRIVRDEENRGRMVTAEEVAARRARVLAHR